MAGPVLPDVIGAGVELAALARAAIIGKRGGARGQVPGKVPRQAEVVKNAVDLAIPEDHGNNI